MSSGTLDTVKREGSTLERRGKGPPFTKEYSKSYVQGIPHIIPTCTEKGSRI